METDLDRLELAGEVVVVGSSLFVQSTGEVAWVSAIHDDHLRIETVDDAGAISVDQFAAKLACGDIVLESSPADIHQSV